MEQKQFTPCLTNWINAELEKRILAAVTRLVGKYSEKSLLETLSAMIGQLMGTRIEKWIAERVEGLVGEAHFNIFQDLVTANLVCTMKENTSFQVSFGK